MIPQLNKKTKDIYYKKYKKGYNYKLIHKYTRIGYPMTLLGLFSPAFGGIHDAGYWLFLCFTSVLGIILVAIGHLCFMKAQKVAMELDLDGCKIYREIREAEEDEKDELKREQDFVFALSIDVQPHLINLN